MYPLSDAVQIAIIAAAATSFPSILSAIFSYRASLHSRIAAEQSVQTEKNTNGMKAELVTLTKTEAYARGVIAGKLEATSAELDRRL